MTIEPPCPVCGLALQVRGCTPGKCQTDGERAPCSHCRVVMPLATDSRLGLVIVGHLYKGIRGGQRCPGSLKAAGPVVRHGIWETYDDDGERVVTIDGRRVDPLTWEQEFWTRPYMPTVGQMPSPSADKRFAAGR